MTTVDIFFAVAPVGGWVLFVAGLFTVVWVIVRATVWAWRLLAAADQWLRDTQADPAPDEVFDQLDRDLTEYAYKIQALYVKEGEGQ